MADKEKSENNIRPAIISFLVWGIAWLIGITLRIRYDNYQELEKSEAEGRGFILVSWHGRTLIPAFAFRNRGYWALVSLSRDGNIQDRIFRRFGYRTVRGSTGRGGVKAVLQLSRKIHEGGVLAFTPDGPRGPSHKVQEGAIFLAQRSGCPLLPCGFSAHPRKLLPTWDKYLIPMPFARAGLVMGNPIFIPAELSEEEKCNYIQQVEDEINRVEKRAEELAGAIPPTAPKTKA